MRWRADGKEIIFAGSDNSPMAVDVSANGLAFQAGIPHQLFKVSPGSGQWAVTPDGKKFLIRVASGPDAAGSPITVVSDWQAGLRK